MNHRPHTLICIPCILYMHIVMLTCSTSLQQCCVIAHIIIKNVSRHQHQPPTHFTLVLNHHRSSSSHTMSACVCHHYTHTIIVTMTTRMHCTHTHTRVHHHHPSVRATSHSTWRFSLTTIITPHCTSVYFTLLCVC